jgi:hypothetical protein
MLTVVTWITVTVYVGIIISIIAHMTKSIAETKVQIHVMLQFSLINSSSLEKEGCFEVFVNEE